MMISYAALPLLIYLVGVMQWLAVLLYDYKSLSSGQKLFGDKLNKNYNYLKEGSVGSPPKMTQE